MVQDSLDDGGCDENDAEAGGGGEKGVVRVVSMRVTVWWRMFGRLDDRRRVRIIYKSMLRSVCVDTATMRSFDPRTTSTRLTVHAEVLASRKSSETQCKRHVPPDWHHVPLLAPTCSEQRWILAR